MLRVTEFQVMEQRMRENFNRIRIKCEVLLSEQVEHLIKDKALLDEKIDHLVKENQGTQFVHLIPGKELRCNQLCTNEKMQKL